MFERLTWMRNMRRPVECAEMHQLRAQLFRESERPLRGMPEWVRRVFQCHFLHDLSGWLLSKRSVGRLRELRRALPNVHGRRQQHLFRVL